MSDTLDLASLARQKFGTVTAAEKRLFEEAANVRAAEFVAVEEGLGKGVGAVEDGDGRIIRAERIAWLCTEPAARALVSSRGIHIRGARIEGHLDLYMVQISFPLVIQQSSILEGMNLEGSRISILDLSGSRTGAINAAYCQVESGVFLRKGFEARGLVCLDGSKIGGPLDCTDASFVNWGKPCLEANGAKVSGSILFHNGFKAEGMVGLVGATIEGNLECNQGLFLNRDKVALNADGLRVRGDVFLCDGFWGEGKEIRAEGFGAEGEVKLVGAQIGGSLECRGGKFINRGESSLQMTGLKVSGDVLLHYNFSSEGMVSLVGAQIGGNLECNQSEFINNGKVALNADRIEVRGDVFLCDGCWHKGITVGVERFRAEGEVKLVGAVIGGSLEVPRWSIYELW